MKLLSAILLLCVSAMLPASAADSIFIRAKNPVLPALTYAGDSLAEEFPGRDGWFHLSSLSFGIENSIDLGSSSGGAGAGKAKALPVSALKFPNSASAAFFTACALGAHWDEFEIVFAKTAEMGLATTMRVEFKMVAITSVAVVGNDGGDQPQETVGLAYGAHRITFFGSDKGKPVQTGQTIWSFVLNAAAYAVQ